MQKEKKLEKTEKQSNETSRKEPQREDFSALGAKGKWQKGVSDEELEKESHKGGSENDYKRCEEKVAFSRGLMIFFRSLSAGCLILFQIMLR